MPVGAQCLSTSLCADVGQVSHWTGAFRCPDQPMNKPFSTDRAARRRAWLAGLGVVVAAFACRWFWTAQERAVRWDEPDFLILARNLLRGVGYQVFGKPELIWPPGAPILAASSMLAGVATDQALAVWHVVAGAAGHLWDRWLDLVRGLKLLACLVHEGPDLAHCVAADDE